MLGDSFLPVFDNKSIARAKGVVLVLSLAIATALAASIKIEIGLVPITLQTLVVLMSGILFGKKIGSASQVTYLLAGLAGIPWFSRGGGFAYLLSPTFGYIVGFVVAAYIVGYLAENGWSKRFVFAVAAMAAGNVAIYLLGGLWLLRFIPAADVLPIGIYPFIVGDLLKILVAGLILPAAWKLSLRI